MQLLPNTLYWRYIGPFVYFYSVSFEAMAGSGFSSLKLSLSPITLTNDIREKFVDLQEAGGC